MLFTRALGFRASLISLAGLVTGIVLSASATGAEPGSLPAIDAEQWALQKEVDNIRIYTMDQPGSGFQAFKAVAELDAPSKT